MIVTLFLLSLLVLLALCLSDDSCKSIRHVIKYPETWMLWGNSTCCINSDVVKSKPSPKDRTSSPTEEVTRSPIVLPPPEVLSEDSSGEHYCCCLVYLMLLLLSYLTF